jgi:hypothetical protein
VEVLVTDSDQESLLHGVAPEQCRQRLFLYRLSKHVLCPIVLSMAESISAEYVSDPNVLL